MHPGLKLRHIRCFLDIASAGGISVVARAQGLTQPALSRTLAELEAMLGKTLFLREGRRLILTDEGRLYRRHAAAALQMLEAGSSALDPDGGGRLRIGILPTVAATFFPAVALRFKALQPDCLLSVETGPHFFLMQQLQEKAIDMMIGRLPRPDEMAGLSFDHLYEDEVVLVARPDHPASNHPDADPSLETALARSPLILPPSTALIRAAVDGYLGAIGLGSTRPLLETANLALGREVCIASDAIWFISHGVVAREIAHGQLARLPLSTRIGRGAVGITARHSTSNHAANLLREIAHHLAEKRLAESWGP